VRLLLVRPVDRDIDVGRNLFFGVGSVNAEKMRLGFSFHRNDGVGGARLRRDQEGGGEPLAKSAWMAARVLTGQNVCRRRPGRLLMATVLFVIDAPISVG